MPNDLFSGLAQMLNRLDELEQESKRFKRLLHKQEEKISSLTEQVMVDKPKPTGKVANIWWPDEYIRSNDERLWKESKLFRSQWALQYAIRELGCPFVSSKGCTRKRVCKASVLEEWINNPDVRLIMEKTKKMRNKQKKAKKSSDKEYVEDIDNND